MCALVLMLAIGLGGRSPIVVVVDLVEVNHFYDEESGEHKFNQVVLYEIDPVTKMKMVIDWYMLEKGRLDRFPSLIHGTNGCYLRWPDNKEIKVVSRMFEETWTTYDPERENKKIFPEKHRVGILKRAGK